MEVSTTAALMRITRADRTRTSTRSHPPCCRAALTREEPTQVSVRVSLPTLTGWAHRNRACLERSLQGPFSGMFFARRMPLQCVLSGSRTLAGHTRGRTAERNNNTSARKACGADVGPARPQIATERAVFPGAPPHVQTPAAWCHGPRLRDGAVLVGADRVAQQVGLGQARDCLVAEEGSDRIRDKSVLGVIGPAAMLRRVSRPSDPACCGFKAGQGPRPGPEPPLPRGYGRGVWPGRR